MDQLLQEAMNASRTGQVDAALLQLKEIAERFPTSFPPRYLLAAELASAQQYDAALASYAEALALYPDHSICRFQYALLLLTLGKLAFLDEMLEPLLQLPQAHYLNRFALALQYVGQSRPGDAELPLREGLASNAELPDLNRDMTVLLQRVLAFKNAEQLTLQSQNTGMFETEVSLPAEVLIRGYAASRRNH